MAESEPWVWFKVGKHVEEGHRLVQKCADETHDPSLTAEVEVRCVKPPNGEPITFIMADGSWWREQLRVHSNGWKGIPLSVLEREYKL